MASECFTTGIWVDWTAKAVSLCPACMLEAVGRPITRRNVLTALLTAVVFCHQSLGIDVDLDLNEATNAYMKGYENDPSNRHPH